MLLFTAELISIVLEPGKVLSKIAKIGHTLLQKVNKLKQTSLKFKLVASFSSRLVTSSNLKLV